MPDADDTPARGRAPRPRGVIAIAALFALLLAIVAVRWSAWHERRAGPSPASPPAAPAPAPSDTTVVPTAQIEVNGQRVIFSAPVQASAKAVIYAHGRGGDAASAFRPGPMGTVTKALVDNGYLVAASDAHGDAWGNDASVQDQVALAGWLREQGKSQLYLLAESMGGLSSLRAAGTIQARTWAGIYPVCDAASVTRFAKDIADVWGTASPAGLSPVLPPPGLPVMAWASPADTVVPKRDNADVCAAGHVVTTTGDHGDASNFDPAALVAFFDANP